MKLRYTRAMITAALKGAFNEVEFTKEPFFGLAVPQSCPNVPAEVLNPRETWEDKQAYDEKAQELAANFRKNFTKFEEFSSYEITAGGPLA